jgi:hypothetical protein
MFLPSNLTQAPLVKADATPESFMKSDIQTYLTARGLCSYAGVSMTLLRSRIDAGLLPPVAVLSNGDPLYSYEQAPIVSKNFKTK